MPFCAIFIDGEYNIGTSGGGGAAPSANGEYSLDLGGPGFTLDCTNSTTVGFDLWGVDSAGVNQDAVITGIGSGSTLLLERVTNGYPSNYVIYTNSVSANLKS